MTVWYDEEENAVIANNAEDFAHFNDDGELVLSVDDMSRGTGKTKEFAEAFNSATEANE